MENVKETSNNNGSKSADSSSDYSSYTDKFLDDYESSSHGNWQWTAEELVAFARAEQGLDW